MVGANERWQEVADDPREHPNTRAIARELAAGNLRDDDGAEAEHGMPGGDR